LLEDWVKRQVPVDVLGLQAHLDLSRRFSQPKLLAFFDEMQALGLTIQITELDVRDNTSAGSLAERDSAVAGLYKDFFDACLSHPAVEMMVLWNVTDADTWINRWGQGQRRADGQPMRPTLFDEQGQPKRAFDTVAASLRQAKIKFYKKVGTNV
jgi:endo-1,4-beta-xylanase